MLTAMKTKTDDPVLRAIRATRGTSSRIARAIGVTPQAIQNWTRVPEPHLDTVAEILKLKPWDIRPDLYRRRKP